ncbi:MAG: c-type cytochrome [Terrimonas sp.]|nr:c-type cytochrome [Terrimonas sp.]
MIPCNSIVKKLSLCTFVFLAFFSLQVSAQDGKQLFQGNCASCHNPFQNGTGPALKGLEDRGPWGDRNNIYAWVHNPVGFMATNKYTQDLKAQYGGTMMTAFPGLKTEEIDAIVSYINEVQPPVATKPTGGGSGTDNSGRNALIFGVISLILAIIALILMQVNSNLKKLSDDKEGILRPEAVPFWKNKIYIAMTIIVLFVVGGFYVVKGAIGMGRQIGYEPEQPIFYSHKVHAGINQINCLYCHGNAWESKHAAIPSTNVCMNCHKNIGEYKGDPLFDADGKEVNGTEQIKKLYAYAGFDPLNPNAWDANKAKSIPWIKIHNLPDHVYFNHSQHIRAGNVQCQTCHGEITAMDEVKQFSELSMGWCINCHRQTKVNFYNIDSTGTETGNKFYSIYEKFRKDLMPDTLKDNGGKYILDKNGKFIIHPSKMDSVTVKDIGGIECQKCHY